MKPTAELFEAYLGSATKCWLLSQGAIGEGNAYADWVKAQNEAFRAVSTAAIAADRCRRTNVSLRRPEGTISRGQPGGGWRWIWK